MSTSEAKFHVGQRVRLTDRGVDHVLAQSIVLHTRRYVKTVTGVVRRLPEGYGTAYVVELPTYHETGDLLWYFEEDEISEVSDDGEETT